jgi:type VI secretion system secreted protein VgrG
MPTYTQTDRPLIVTTPLGKDVLLLTGFRGHEGISELFSF